MHPHTQSILQPLFDTMNKECGKGGSVGKDMEEEQLFKATEGTGEIREPKLKKGRDDT